TQNLPLLDPLRQIPVVGNPLAELVQPDFRVIVDLGYGDGYANVPTPAGLFHFVNPLTVGSELLTGAQQGVVAALVDIGLLPSTDLPTTYPYLPLVEPQGRYSYPASHRRCPTRRARRAPCCRRPPRCRRTSSICSVVAAQVRCLATSSDWAAN
ncbi:MAG TPA: PE-PPE domain-containing protein, partial [Mycobacterium sp.]|nr:PE-PPE domain-containing protein [Mycobacterium sp.]